MRENRPYGSEGGGTEFNRSFLPLSLKEVRSSGTKAFSVRTNLTDKQRRIINTPRTNRG